MEGSQDRMQNEVNLRLQQLGLPPGAKEANNGEIFARFMLLAAQKGVYIGNMNRDEEEDEEGDGEENVQGSQQYDSDATTDGGTEDEAQPEDEEEKSGRGPTELKGFWKNYEPNQKVNVEFNHLGQPCSIKTSELANFIGSLVKGKEISLEYSHWSHVPKFKKEKLWNTVKFFFNIDDIYKDWVISSAGKKWKDFKCWLKIKHYDDELTTRQNIAKGCGKRIPRSQWKWLVRYWKTDRAKALSELNKLARESQSNARHTVTPHFCNEILKYLNMSLAS